MYGGAFPPLQSAIINHGDSSSTINDCENDGFLVERSSGVFVERWFVSYKYAQKKEKDDEQAQTA